MPLHKNKNRFFKEHRIRLKKLVIVFIVFILFIQGLNYLLHHTPTQLFTIKEHAVEDIDFSDIYYQTRDVDLTKNKQVVLINISSWPPELIRYKLVTLLDSINLFKPRAIGVDVYFVPKADTISFKEVNKKLDTLFHDPKIVIGADYASLSEFPLDTLKPINFGYINKPGKDGETFREYYNQHAAMYLHNVKQVPSFACKLYEVFNGSKLKSSGDSTFIIRYSSGTEAGFYNALTIKDPQVLLDTMQDFPAFEADDIIAAYPKNGLRLNSLMRNKCVIIGVLGKPDIEYKNDLTDKHRVPLDFQLFNRMPTMPGAVVHANALQMLIDHKEIYNIDGWLFDVIAGFIIFLYLFMFNVLEKIRPFLLKLFIEILFLVLSIMLLIDLGAILMGYDYHINMGKIILYIAFLIEYKMFAFELYEYLEKQSLHKRLSGWYSSVRSFFSKKALNSKTETAYMKVEIEIETEIIKTGNDEA